MFKTWHRKAPRLGTRLLYRSTSHYVSVTLLLKKQTFFPATSIFYSFSSTIFFKFERDFVFLDLQFNLQIFVSSYMCKYSHGDLKVLKIQKISVRLKGCGIVYLYFFQIIKRFHDETLHLHSVCPKIWNSTNRIS